MFDANELDSQEAIVVEYLSDNCMLDLSVFEEVLLDEIELDGVFLL